MTAAEKLDEIVKVLEQGTSTPCSCLPYAKPDSPEECASCANARAIRHALTLAKELRENTYAGWVHPNATGLMHSYTSADFFLERPHKEYHAALLILSEPKP